MGSELSILATEEARQDLLNLNDGELPSVVFDATGNKQSMINAFDYVSHGGKLIYAGLVNETISFFHPDFHAKELSLLASRNALKEDFEYVARCLIKGLFERLNITNKISFDEVCAFFRWKIFGRIRRWLKLAERGLFFSRMEINRLSKNKKYGNYL